MKWYAGAADSSPGLATSGFINLSLSLTRILYLCRGRWRSRGPLPPVGKCDASTQAELEII